MALMYNTVKQFALLSVLVSIWLLWLTFTMASETLGQSLLALGAALSAGGLIYRQLPLDLIPDCIPIIGKVDDVLAGATAIFGAFVMALGVALGI
mmetsp:Transcript_124941/g.216592  ORF Transcript_124941/g.216592 Transcript_124941/m.216592 type:complete len:95 (+) Transcript_124941:69-353(+)